jgi:hypothetical protein
VREIEVRKQELAKTVAKYLAADRELLQNFRQFDITEVSYDQSPQSFYCGWVMSIMGTAFYRRWNEIRQQVSQTTRIKANEDWATISAMAHDLVSSDE